MLALINIPLKILRLARLVVCFATSFLIVGATSQNSVQRDKVNENEIKSCEFSGLIS